MPIRLSRFVLPAVLAATIPAAAVLAQTQTQGQSAAKAEGPSQETMTRLEDGRIAMIKGALKLSDEQSKLWAPVEQQIRASFAARREARTDRRERRQSGQSAERPALPDRLDRASKRMAERAERMKTYAEAIRPFYASLTDDQKAVAGVVLGRSAGACPRAWSALVDASRAPRRTVVAAERAHQRVTVPDRGLTSRAPGIRIRPPVRMLDYVCGSAAAVGGAYALAPSTNPIFSLRNV